MHSIAEGQDRSIWSSSTVSGHNQHISRCEIPGYWLKAEVSTFEYQFPKIGDVVRSITMLIWCYIRINNFKAIIFRKHIINSGAISESSCQTHELRTFCLSFSIATRWGGRDLMWLQRGFRVLPGRSSGCNFVAAGRIWRITQMRAVPGACARA